MCVFQFGMVKMLLGIVLVGVCGLLVGLVVVQCVWLIKFGDVMFGVVLMMVSDLLNVQSVCVYVQSLLGCYNVCVIGSGVVGVFMFVGSGVLMFYEVQWNGFVNQMSGMVLVVGQVLIGLIVVVVDEICMLLIVLIVSLVVLLCVVVFGQVIVGSYIGMFMFIVVVEQW